MGSHPAHQGLRAWVVTLNVDKHPAAPIGGVWHRYCMAIDVATGKPILAYPADYDPQG